MSEPSSSEAVFGEALAHFAHSGCPVLVLAIYRS